MNGYLNWRGSIVFFCCAMLLMGVIDQKTKDALKVKHILKTIERYPPHSDGKDLSAEVTQTELNAYIAHRLEQEKRPFINGIKIDLLENNHVRGKISFDAAHLNLSLLLGDNLDFDFSGIFYSRNGAARLDLISLYLGGHPVKPQVLDFVLSTAARYYGTEFGGTGDWYALPKGIKRVMGYQAKAVLYY